LLAVTQAQMRHAMSENVCPAFRFFDTRRMDGDVAVWVHRSPAVGGERDVLASGYMASLSETAEERMFAENIPSRLEGDVGA